MKKSIYSLLLMGIIQFTIMNAQTDTLLSCYPMSIGNIWQYKLSHHKYGSPIADQYYTVTVRADTVIDGKVYQIFSSTLSSSDYKGIYPPYQRIDTSSMVVYAYDTSAGGKEYLMDSLLAGSSSTRYRFNNYPAYYSTFYQFVTEFGTVRNVRVLWTWILSETEVFAVLHEYPGIGIIWSKSGSYNGEISFNTDWFSDSLVYAKIDTKEYGTLVSVKREKYSPKLYSLNQNYPIPSIQLRLFNLIFKNQNLLN